MRVASAKIRTVLAQDQVDCGSFSPSIHIVTQSNHLSHPLNPLAVVVDTDVGFFTPNADLTSDTSQPHVGANYRYTRGTASSSPRTAKFTIPHIPAGTYVISESHIANANRGNAVKHVIQSSVTGASTVYVNQKVNGAQWNSLGSFTFSGSGSEYVLISSEGSATNAYVGADAITISLAARGEFNSRTSIFFCS